MGIKLPYFETDTSDLKITPIFQDEALLNEMGVATQALLPDASAYYATPITFPAPCDTRPYIVSSIVLSADGKMAYMDNPQGPLIAKCNLLDTAGGAGDFWCLNMLRAHSDALLVGAMTLRNEPENINFCMDSTLFAQRQQALGKPRQPVQVVVSLDATDIPFDHVTFSVDASEEMKLMIATSPAGWEHIQKSSPLQHQLVGPFTSEAEIDAAQFPILDGDYHTYPVIVTGDGAMPDMKLMLYALRKLGIETVCAESPAYCGALMAQGCLDEYFINYSMVYAGGTMTPGHNFPTSWTNHPHADLVSVGIHHRNFLFTRQRIRYGVQ